MSQKDPIEKPLRSTKDVSSVHAATRELFISGEAYTPERIASSVPTTPEGTYIQQQLWEKFAMVRKYAKEGVLLDICCGNGAHLNSLDFFKGLRIGLDYSKRYLEYGQKNATALKNNSAFIRAEATVLPFAVSCIDVTYCFSSLYVLDHYQRFLEEIFRILKPGGLAIIDLANKRSLNYFCSSYYPKNIPLTCKEIGKNISQCRSTGFEIVEHRSFQLLPLWADKPRWLWPLLHPKWNDIMKKRIKGKMLDEWISSLPGIRCFAFRHLVVCRKPEKK